MLNIISVILGIVALILAIVGFIPAIGFVNWISLPFSILGLIFGIFSHRNSGRDFCLVVMIVSMFRLFMGGGIF